MQWAADTSLWRIGTCEFPGRERSWRIGMAASTTKEGYLKKNHAGSKFAAAHKKRWFLTSGFTVSYFRENDKRSLKGHFDLRNVLGIQPLKEAGGDAGDLAAA